MLHDWSKNIARLFSAYLSKETHESCCVTLGNFILVHLRFSWLQVKSCLYFVISKELKPEGKQIPMKPDRI